MREFQRKFFLLIPLSTAKRRRKPACTASFPSHDGASLQHLASSSFRETDHRLSFGCRTGRAQGSLGYLITWILNFKQETMPNKHWTS